MSTPNVAFIVPLADEGRQQIEACLGFLRAAYSDATIVVISDGVSDPDYPGVCARHRAKYVLGAYLKRIECGGAWWKRVFESGLATGADWIVKLDPDARLHRPFRVEPGFAIAGTLERDGTGRDNVQGGCQAISRAAARRIVESGLTADRALATHDTLAEDRPQWRSWNAKAYLSTDRSLMWLARNLGIECGDWPEVGSRNESPAPDNADRRFAATHPHKIEAPRQFDEAPLRVITTCKGRLYHLQKTLPRWLAEPDVAVTVVDYGCPQDTAGWVRATHPEVQVVKVKGVDRFNLARARNVGAAAAPEGWWCFWDADCLAPEGWSTLVRRSLRHRRYLLADPIQWDQFGSVVMHSLDHRSAGGYDENFKAWGSEDSDLYLRLRQVGIHPGSFPGDGFASVKHTDADRVAHYDVKQIDHSRRFYGSYIGRKSGFMLATGRLPDRVECRQFLEETCRSLGFGIESPYYPPPVDPPLIVEIVEEVAKLIEDVEKVIKEVIADIDHGRLPHPPHVAPAPHHPCGQPVPIDAHAVITPVRPIPPALEHPPAKLPLPLAVPLPHVAIRKPRPMFTISLINHSTHDLGTTLDILAKVGEAYLALVDGYWAGTAARVIPSKVILPNTRAIVLVDHSDQANALGYHSLSPDGEPVGQVAVLDSLADGSSVADVLTHELAEMQVDSDCNLEATAADGTVFALEVGDPVQGDSFILPVEGYKARVSNFVTPAWFQSDRAPGSRQFDYLKLVQAPFTLRPGGYAAVSQSGTWTQIFADVATQQNFRGKPLGRFNRRKAKAARQRTHAHPAYLAVDHRAATR